MISSDRHPTRGTEFPSLPSDPIAFPRRSALPTDQSVPKGFFLNEDLRCDDDLTATPVYLKRKEGRGR